MPITFNNFKDIASDILNINLSGYKLKRVQRRTESLMRRHNIADYDECLRLLKDDPSFKEAYLSHFTINTSEFYRNPENFKYLEDKLLPEIFKNNSSVKIWSAPCSNGSEPYTLALILSESNYKKYQILASDLDTDILNTAKTGVYSPNSLENIPTEVFNKYFTLDQNSNKKYILSGKIKNQVNFEQMDLINDPFLKDWHLILSRNFFIYLTNEIKDMLCHKFSSVLKPGGYLFLGNTEFIFNPQKYGLEKVYSSFYRKL